jgi:predicted kinase
MSITVDPNRKRRPTLIITRGNVASGKSTAAIAWVRAEPAWRVRANRDDLRTMGHGGYLGTDAQEAIVSGFQHNGVRVALSHGTDVIVDDTNLRQSDVNLFAGIAQEMEADFEVWDFRHVPLQVCIDRDAQRDRYDRVGEDVLRHKHDKYIKPWQDSLGAGEPIVPTRVMTNG